MSSPQSQTKNLSLFVGLLALWTIILSASFYFASLSPQSPGAQIPCEPMVMFKPIEPIKVTEHESVATLQPWNNPPRSEDEERLLGLLKQAAALAHPGFKRTVIILLSNSGFHEMLINFIHFAHKTNPPVLNYIVFPLDQNEFKNVSDMNVRMFWPKDGHNFSPRARNFRSDAYNSIVMHKWVVAEQVMALGFDPFVVDIDNVFVRNPFNFLADYAKCDCAATTDSQSPATLLENDARWNGQGHKVYINSGFVLWKNTQNSINMIRAVLNNNRRTDDQDVFCEIIDDMMDKYEKEGKNNLVNVPPMERHRQCSDLGGFQFSMLPPGLFGSQKMIFEGAIWPQRQGFPPYVIHFGYLAGFYNKRVVMAQHGFYYRPLSEADMYIPPIGR